MPLTRKTALRFHMLLSLLAATILLANCGPFEARGTRVVLITLDTLRFDSFQKDPGRAGDARASDMPHLVAWAEDAAIFASFFAATSQTQPTHASMFTGLHPWQHGVNRNGLNLVSEKQTVAEILKQAGFTTTAVVASYPLSRKFGFERGFDVLEDEFERGKRGFWLSEEEKKTDGDKPFFSRADVVTQKALALIDQAAGSDRQFFWFHYFDPHDPYGVSTDDGPRAGPLEALELAKKGEDPTNAVRRARELYDQDVAFLDHWLAKVLERLDEPDGFTTHVIVVSDHGESFGEDGSMAHGTRLTPGQIRVPCLIRSSKLKPGWRQDVTGSADIAPTILALAGVQTSYPLAGRDLSVPPKSPPRAFGMLPVYGKGAKFPRLDGKEHPIDTPSFYTIIDGHIVKGNSEKIIDLPASLPAGDQEILRLQLQQLFSVFEAELSGAPAEENPDPEVRKTLEALGYIT